MFAALHNGGLGLVSGPDWIVACSWKAVIGPRRETSRNRNLQFPGLRYPVIKKPCEHPKIAEDET
jgi:hypothetical protein